MRNKLIIGLIALFLLEGILIGQQFPDTLWVPPEFLPKYEAGKGTMIYIDAFHNNFHTREGRYSPFAKVLELDGYKTVTIAEPFTRESLIDKHILVISNALPLSSIGNWVAPTESAFSSAEIVVLEEWVNNGGRLFLIADHMPMAGAAAALAEAFGYYFLDGFADDTLSPGRTEIFSSGDNSLRPGELTDGRQGYFEVDSVFSFTGQAFKGPELSHSVLHCRDSWKIYLPDTAWVFNQDTRIQSAAGWSQGAYQRYGKGKLVIFGEAAMFTAQIVENNGSEFRFGMNGRLAKNNYKLLLNCIRWLDEE